LVVILNTIMTYQPVYVDMDNGEEGVHGVWRLEPDPTSRPANYLRNGGINFSDMMSSEWSRKNEIRDYYHCQRPDEADEFDEPYIEEEDVFSSGGMVENVMMPQDERTDVWITGPRHYKHGGEDYYVVRDIDRDGGVRKVGGSGAHKEDGDLRVALVKGSIYEEKKGERSFTGASLSNYSDNNLINYYDHKLSRYSVRPGIDPEQEQLLEWIEIDELTGDQRKRYAADALDTDSKNRDMVICVGSWDVESARGVAMTLVRKFAPLDVEIVTPRYTGKLEVASIPTDYEYDELWCEYLRVRSLEGDPRITIIYGKYVTTNELCRSISDWCVELVPTLSRMYAMMEESSLGSFNVRMAYALMYLPYNKYLAYLSNFADIMVLPLYMSGIQENNGDDDRKCIDISGRISEA